MFGLDDHILSFTAVTLPGIVAYNLLDYYTIKFKVYLDTVSKELKQMVNNTVTSNDYEEAVKSLIARIVQRELRICNMYDEVPYKGKVSTVMLTTVISLSEYQLSAFPLFLILGLAIFPIALTLRIYLSKKDITLQYEFLKGLVMQGNLQ